MQNHLSTKPEFSLPLSTDLIVWTPHEAISAGWEGEGSVAETMVFGSLIHVTYLCFQDLLRPDHCIPFLFDNGGLLCTPKFMAWWVRWSVHDGQLRSCRNLVAQGCAFSLHIRPSGRTRALSHKGSSYPHKTGFAPKILRNCAVIDRLATPDSIRTYHCHFKYHWIC